jgi:signal transduction histidine kinase
VTERERGPALHHSVFGKLVAIMLVMAACLLGMVSGFFFIILLPGLHTSLSQLVVQHVRIIAASEPDSTRAAHLAASLDMAIRYEGPRGSWATSPDVPTLAALARERPRHWFLHLTGPWHGYYVMRSADGGAYVFERTVGERFRAAHTNMLIMLMVLMIAVFLTAYAVMRRALRPLRLLSDGVTRLSEGQLDVVVPNTTRDEFGALTRAFNHMARRVKDMVRARDQLLQDVSHELRSPLTRLKVALALLPDGEHKQRMAADTVEMERMIAELLELERLREPGGVRVERHDLIPLLREVAASFADRPPGARIGQAPAEAWLEIDGEKVRTVFRNLIDNAIQYSLPDSRPVEISVSPAARAVVARVADDGPGIPEGDRESLFQPFFRLDASRSRRTGGYGLGLSICRRIVEAHGGTITIEGRSGRGAVFVVTLPVPGRA